MQQSSTTPKIESRDWVAEDCCMLQSSSQCLLVSTVFGMHGVIPTSYFIFNDLIFYASLAFDNIYIARSDSGG